MMCIFKWSKSIGVILIINEDIKCDICRALFMTCIFKIRNNKCENAEKWGLKRK